MHQNSRQQHITACGAVGSEVEELSRYLENAFDLSVLDGHLALPLPDEPFVACWQHWLDEATGEAAGGTSVFDVLKRHLPQLRFPIAEGMRQTSDYRQATLQGVDPDLLDGATGLDLEGPETLVVEIYPSLAGRLPVFKTRGRRQFETLVRALGRRNEPAAIPRAMGAQMVAGFNNWSRIREHQRHWQGTPEKERRHSTWSEAFADLRQHKELYQDRFCILSDGPYSAVAAGDLGLSEAAWRDKSLIIRRDHECLHYLTRRLFGSMRNHLLDELIADYAGIVAAEGRFRGDWFLRFMGLEDRDQLRPGGRLEIYRGDPPLSDGAFVALQRLLLRATDHLERFDSRLTAQQRTPRRHGLALLALATLSIDTLATPDGLLRLQQTVGDLEDRH